MGGSLFFFFSLLIAQFFHLQVIDGKKWKDKARRQHFFTVKEPFIRGSFFSNIQVKEGHPEEELRFVIDVQKFHLFADPDSIPKEHALQMTKEISEILSLNEAETSSVERQLRLKSRSRRLKMWLEREEKEKLLDWWKGYAKEKDIARNALFFQSDYQRSYPYGKMLGQVLHTVRHMRDEVTGQAEPTGGLELYFNRYLHGEQGVRLMMRSPRNFFATGEVVQPPVNGSDVHLTVNHYLQAIVEEELMRGVKKAKAKGGWAVMMNPYTGEVLALGQYPFFYPPKYQEFFNRVEKIDDTKVKSVTDANEPGSVIKPFILALAYLANEELAARGKRPLFNPEEKIPAANGEFPGRRKPIKDEGKVHPYLNAAMAVQKSSNIYFAHLTKNIVAKLGDDWFRTNLLEVVGIGMRTGIELPAESSGVLPKPGRIHPNGKLEWSKPTPYSIAMGHNLQATAMQMARAYSILANGGYLVEPTIVRKIVKKDGARRPVVELDHTDPRRAEEFQRVLPQEIVDEVRHAIRFTTMPGGTSTRGSIPGYTEAGKSGTARKIINGEYSTKKHAASFCGFAPFYHPRFVLVVVIDEPEVRYIPGIGKTHHGGTAAAPVFRHIAKRTLEYLGVAPDNPYGYPKEDPRYNADKADWERETRLLREKYHSWNK